MQTAKKISCKLDSESSFDTNKNGTVRGSSGVGRDYDLKDFSRLRILSA